MGYVVYVQSKNGKTIMPTERYGKVRRMLRDGLAIIVCRNPFTIRLTYKSGEIVDYSKLPLDAVRDSYDMVDFKERSEEKKYFSQCKKQCRDTEFDNPDKQDRIKKWYHKPKRYQKPKRNQNRKRNKKSNPIQNDRQTDNSNPQT